MQFSTRFISLACSICLLLAGPVILHADTDRGPAVVTADGGRYYGALVDGMRQGHGKIEWPNGARYTGGFDKGLYSGRGSYVSASGARYEGDFADGMMAGQGRMEMSDGSIYEGAFEQDHFHGKGTLTSAEGKYIGDFKRGEYSGHGELVYQDGRKYTGEIVRGKFHGKGRYESPEGDVYEGDFDKNEFTGEGKYALKGGSRYQGGFAKWQPHGKGIYTDAQSNVYEGKFTDGALNGAARMIGKDGSRYEGEFLNSLFHGQGVYRLANGDEYKGGFAHGLYDGDGTLSYATPRPDGRSSESGKWRYGTLENKEQEQQAQHNIETALYNQRALLDQALAGLAPQDPGLIDMYMLAVGGDGAQEVFRREVQFVRDQFDREFGTSNRSVVLINSRNTVATLPMATVTSIDESLKGIASRMDKEQDILFLFLTSHGSKDHKFSLAQNGMKLRDLPAKELGRMLKETGIRWKVVLVSACYSGGFIDAVKDDHTLVITAARHDRSSFGCADDNDFTYFGRAFFKEALMNSNSFQDAFGKAKVLVEEWEVKDIKDKPAGDKDAAHSLPQMHDPVAIRAYLQRWREQRLKLQEAAANRPASAQKIR